MASSHPQQQLTLGSRTGNIQAIYYRGVFKYCNFKNNYKASLSKRPYFILEYTQYKNVIEHQTALRSSNFLVS